jgi:nucleoside-triphosphatase
LHLFITGEVGVGKSTLLEKLVSFAGGTSYGFVTEKVHGEPNNRVYIHPYGAKEREYSEENLEGLARPGWFETYAEVFTRRGKELLGNVPPGKLAVMDELGILESRAPEFCSQVLEFLDGPYTVLGVIKPKDTEFLTAVRSHPRVTVLTISKEDREETFKKGTELLKTSYRDTLFE